MVTWEATIIFIAVTASCSSKDDTVTGNNSFHGLSRVFCKGVPCLVAPCGWEVSRGRGRSTSEVLKRGWREGVGDQQRPKYSIICRPELYFPAPKADIGKKVQKNGLNLLVKEECPCANPLCPPTPFRNLWSTYTGVLQEGLRGPEESREN